MLVDASCAYDVSKRQTPEMVEKARIGFAMACVFSLQLCETIFVLVRFAACLPHRAGRSECSAPSSLLHH